MIFGAYLGTCSKMSLSATDREAMYVALRSYFIYIGGIDFSYPDTHNIILGG